jgi:F0F1-type ATP synthase membrane subunit a
MGAATLAAIWGIVMTIIMMAAGTTGSTFWLWVGGMTLTSFVWCMFRLSHQPRRVGIPNLLMMPLNVVGKFAEVLSMSFRLFGNIFGGAIIMALLGGMVHHVALPILLHAFIGIFVGAVQAFVFSMLSMTYITVELAEEHEEEEHHHEESSHPAPATAPAKA